MRGRIGMGIGFLILYGICNASGARLHQTLWFFVGEGFWIGYLWWLRYHTHSMRKILNHLIRLAVLFAAIGLFYQYQCNYRKEGTEMLQIVVDDILCFVAAHFSYWVMYKYGERFIEKVGKISLVLIPFALLYSRLVSHPVSGCYIRLVGGFLTFAFVLICWPFTTVALLGKGDSRTSLYHSFYAMPLNQVIYLAYMAVIILLASINNDFGTAMVVGGSAMIVFLIYGKDWICKLGFSLLSVGGILGACLWSKKLWYRFFVCINLEACINTEDQYLAAQSEALVYLIQNISFSGPYGAGFGTIPKSIFPNRATDYVVSGILYQQGILAVLILAAITLLFLIILMKIEPVKKMENRLAFMIALIFSINMVWVILCNLSVLPVCGLSFPWIAQGTSTNLAFSVLLGIFLAIGNEGYRSK